MKFSNIFPAQTVPYTDCFNTIASQKKKYIFLSMSVKFFSKY